MKLREKSYTYYQMSEMFKIPISTLTKRAAKLKLKGKRLGNDATMYFSYSSAEKIISSIPFRLENHPRKIQIIEMYNQDFIGRDIAFALGISTKLTYNCIREYNKTGSITVESKLNQMILL